MSDGIGGLKYRGDWEIISVGGISIETACGDGRQLRSVESQVCETCHRLDSLRKLVARSHGAFASCRIEIRCHFIMRSTSASGKDRGSYPLVKCVVRE